MITIRRADERGHANYGWLDTHYTFSFADYHDPDWMGFRSLRVINDDVVQGGGGFDTHSHRDMEIITYVLGGALEHKDSMGNGRIIKAGEVQYMAAGTGILHSEFNPFPAEPVHLLQIWIRPERKGAKPAYAERSFASAGTGRLHLIASGSGRDGSIHINQDADVYLARLGAGDDLTHNLRPGRHVWIQIAEGALSLNGQELNAGDGAAVSEEATLRMSATQSARALVFDLN